MTEESNNNQNDQPQEEKQPSDETQPKLREISNKELKQILEDHKKWLESDGKEGKQAALIDANLHKAHLSEANLQQAILGGANLQEANLGGANLQQAQLRWVNMQKAYLFGANLQDAELNNADMQKTFLESIQGLSEANLKHTNFEGATGLLGNEFAQADVTGTKLPEDIKEFKALETVKETSQNARKIFFAMLLGCVYSWLTIATTTDVKLLTNTASSPLPIIQTEIPIAGFYWAAPLVLICLYFYFHLYLLKLWEGLSGLPAIFPDGKRLDERAYPWLLNGLVRRQFNRLKTGRPFMAYIQDWITIFLAWWVVPITMMAFWLRFLPRHDWIGTCLHIGLIVVSFGFAIIFYRLCALTLKGEQKIDFALRRFWKDRRFYQGVSVVVVAVLFSLLSYGAIEGLKSKKPNFSEIKILVPWAFEKIGYDVFANFEEKSVSEKPVNYWEISEKNQLKSVQGANLKGRNLNNANMNKAFLVKADLRYALLNYANISKANLHKANLNNANLHQAILRSVILKETGFQEANLQQADLYNADLENSNLRSANLQSVYIANANLRKANLRKANLEQADLGSKAYIPQSPLFSMWLQKTNYLGADLQQANLREANLQQANFLGVNLQETDLTQADLTGAYNITIEQLSKVKTLYKAKLDPELWEQVKKCCPHLLEKPKEEPDKKTKGMPNGTSTKSQ